MSIRRRTFIALPLTLALAACDRSPPAPTSGPAGSGSIQRDGATNLLLITMDTTRADRIGCYGYAAARTPALDALAARGVRFDAAFSHAPITLPSHASLHTGTYPPEHGVRDNGRFLLGPELPTLAEQFRRRGYATAAFVGAQVLSARHGLARGFDHYDDEMPTRPSGKRAWDRFGNVVADRALAWLEREGGRPFFVWAHFFDPHAPRRPPPPYHERFADPYDGEIAFMDDQIGRLVAWLRDRGQLDRTLVVAVADHGESLGEHGFEWHALLIYDSIMRVPLILSWPSRLPAGTVVRDVVRMIDLMPTVLELMGWEIPSSVSGQTLAPLLAGRQVSPRAAYVESDFPFENFGWAKLRGLLDARWKYIRAPRPELYDRVADPRELNNLADAMPEQLRSLEADLEALEASMRTGVSQRAALSAADRAALSSLGYVGSAAPSTLPADRLRNPVDMVEVEVKYRTAQDLIEARRAPQAAPILEECVARSPESFVLQELLGRAYAGCGRLDESVTRLVTALSIAPSSADTLVFLANVQRLRGRLERAVAAAARAVELEPDHAEAQALLPALRAEAAQQRDEIAAARRESQSNPTLEAFQRLAALLDAAGLAGDAEATYRAALARIPQNAGLLNDLAWLLATTWSDTVRDPAQAITLARQAVAITRSSSTLDTLATAQAAAGRFDEAVATSREALALAEKDMPPDPQRIERLGRRLKLFEARTPFREAE